MVLFERLVGRKPQLSLDTLVPQVDDTERSTSRSGKRHRNKARHRSRLEADDGTIRKSAGAVAQIDDLVVADEKNSNIDQNIVGGKLEIVLWMDLENIGNHFYVVGLIIEVVMEEILFQTCLKSPGGIKPFYARPLNLYHPFVNDFVQCS